MILSDDLFKHPYIPLIEVVSDQDIFTNTTLLFKIKRLRDGPYLRNFVKIQL